MGRAACWRWFGGAAAVAAVTSLMAGADGHAAELEAALVQASAGSDGTDQSANEAVRIRVALADVAVREIRLPFREGVARRATEDLRGDAGARLAAIRELLDLDALDQADAALEALGSSWARATQGGEDTLDVLGEITAARRGAARALDPSWQDPVPDLQALARGTWLDSRGGENLPADFLGRQRFRLLADLMRIWRGEPTMRIRRVQMAAELLLELPVLPVPMVGPGDLERLATLQEIVAGALGLDASAPGVGPPVAKGDPGPGGSRHGAPGSLLLDTKVAFAARIIAAVGAPVVFDAGLVMIPAGDGEAVLEVDPRSNLQEIERRIDASPDLRVVPPQPGT